MVQNYLTSYVDAPLTKICKMLFKFLEEKGDALRLENVVGLLEKLRNDNPDGRIQKDWKILPSHSLRS